MIYGLLWVTLWSCKRHFVNEFHSWLCHLWKSLANHLSCVRKIIIHDKSSIISNIQYIHLVYVQPISGHAWCRSICPSLWQGSLSRLPCKVHRKVSMLWDINTYWNWHVICQLLDYINLLVPRRCSDLENENFKLILLMVSSYLKIMPSDECHGSLMMISQHWFR